MTAAAHDSRTTIPGALPDRPTLTELWAARHLVVNLAAREIRSRYRVTVLGQLWSLVHPIAQIAILSFVFGWILELRPERSPGSGLDVFALWLSAALLPWLFFAAVVSTGLGALVGNANLIKKVYFPRAALLAANTAAGAFTFAIEMLVLVGAVLVFGGQPLVYLPATLALMLLLAVFALGVSCIFAVANVFFRDTQHLVGILMQAWFYLTPVIYDAGRFTERDGMPSIVGDLYYLNPMVRFCESFRSTLYHAEWPALSDLAYLVGATTITLLLACLLFRGQERRLAEEL